MVTRTVTVDVDVDLCDFDTDELLDELQDRNAIGNVGDLGRMRQDMLRALWEKDEARALNTLRDYLCEVMNRASI